MAVPSQLLPSALAPVQETAGVEPGGSAVQNEHKSDVNKNQLLTTGVGNDGDGDVEARSGANGELVLAVPRLLAVSRFETIVACNPTYTSMAK